MALFATLSFNYASTSVPLAPPRRYTYSQTPRALLLLLFSRVWAPSLSLLLSFALSSAFLAREKPPPSSVGFSAAIARDSEGCGRRSEGSRIRTARSRATKARSAANFTTDAAFFRRAISFLSNLAVERVDLRRGRKKRFHTETRNQLFSVNYFKRNNE